MKIAIVNCSPQFHVEFFKPVVMALNAQVSMHLCQAWGLSAVSVVGYSSLAEVPKSMPLIAIWTDADEPGVLGEHTEGVDGHVFGKVFTSPILKNGGTQIDGSNSISAVLSHEVCETIIDRFVSTWDAYGTRLLAREVCDPVENDHYTMSVTSGGFEREVSLSNFVYPEYFDSGSVDGAKFDQLGKLHAPFSMTPDGYQVWLDGGEVSTIFGDRYPDWKKETKNIVHSRKSRRFPIHHVTHIHKKVERAYESPVDPTGKMGVKSEYYEILRGKP